MPGRPPIDLGLLLESAARHGGKVGRVALDLGCTRNTVRNHRARLRESAPHLWPWPDSHGGTPDHLGPSIRRGWPRGVRRGPRAIEG